MESYDIRTDFLNIGTRKEVKRGEYICNPLIDGITQTVCYLEQGAEIDFIIQRDGQIIPIEVKSADNTRAKSLKLYMDAFKPAYAITCFS